MCVCVCVCVCVWTILLSNINIDTTGMTHIKTYLCTYRWRSSSTPVFTRLHGENGVFLIENPLSRTGLTAYISRLGFLSSRLGRNVKMFSFKPGICILESYYRTSLLMKVCNERRILIIVIKIGNHVTKIASIYPFLSHFLVTTLWI